MRRVVALGMIQHVMSQPLVRPFIQHLYSIQHLNYALLILVDPAWINFASVPEGGYSLGSNNPPMYAPPVSVSPTTYPSSFWTYDSYPQFHPSPTEAPSMHYSEGTSSFITHQLRSSSVDSNSSVSSSLATPTNFPQIDQVQVVGEGQIQISKISLPSRPSAKAQAPGSNIRLKSQSSEKLKAYKTVQCKFFNKPPNFCSRGNQCTFIHTNPSIESGESPQEMELKDSGSPKKSLSPSLPNKPLTRIDARRQKGFYPVTWRVIGGGVLMGIHKPGLDMVSKAETQDSEGLDYSLMEEQSSEKFYPATSAPGGASNDRSRKRTISNPSPRNAAFAVGIFPAESP
ncbi:hypothetical protein D9757_007069 [Collybiopsis confluens]|uniref:C3H1-type domain-containing protein n=1 Tax=Collybiopsis confluens TaxID=2823264 RepID=A0A8H5M494_9AGAR|nr:hypothetical protein D9757_007069 [Collybiopsis confluens]